MKVIVSRVDDRFLYKSLNTRFPEIILPSSLPSANFVWRPGERAKVSVEFVQAPGSDPVGASVGYRGKRIQSIVKESNNENIDVIYYTDEPQDLYAGTAAGKDRS